MATTLQKHTITAFYESRDYADRAAEKLRAMGILASDVTVSPDTAQSEYGVYGDDRNAVDAPRKTGFWASLEEMFGGTDDHHTYAEGVRRGHVLLTAHVADAQLDRAVAIVEEHGSIDLDEHEETWRSEGWTGAPSTYSSSAGATAATAGGAMGMALAGRTAPTRVVETETVVERAPVTAPVVAPKPVAAPTLAAKPALSTGMAGRGGEDVVQVVEERINVGKRAVSRGKVRLHSYVVENQVSEDVTLRDETVSIDRHAVDRPVAALGEDAFRERTIELEEIDEEAVVAKTARVVEEIGIRKDVSDRVETVRDTVRSTKVDIEDGRTVGTTAVGTTGNVLSRLVKDVEVVGSDGVHVGIVDRVEGAMMKLKRKDATDGQHHLLPTDLVRSVDGKAMLSIAAAEAMRRWKAV
ncbi:DUF2382 domain-containing protein [Lichenibacterium minor]|uniref:DUF2382 domain-containing protein n=1 Tax=Lichenibacterium minor TaxID=2316528 RepID=A0A4Q2U3L1_9HYPH|nr:DUF2382 domain-containing protein [Lichenibacterium minor]RYC29325.1 DUF2382 domain-containing protein [Lichenibacterium minor]